MGTINVVSNDGLKAATHTWTGLATGDEGSAIKTEGKELVAQVTGTFGGATVAIQGSNDGVNFVGLNDKSVPGNACSFTSAGLKGVLQVPKYIKPVVTGGAGSGLTITLFNTKD